MTFRAKRAALSFAPTGLDVGLPLSLAIAFPCRHRGKRRQAGVYDCHSTKFIGLKLVNRTACEACAVRDHPPESAPTENHHHIPCAHLGDSCQHQVAHFACSHPRHGPRTTRGQCQTCAGYVFPWFTPTLPERMVRRLIELGPNEQLDGWWQLPNVQQGYRRLARKFRDELPSYPGGSQGKGIVILGGGSYFPSAYVTIRVLRHVGCPLPIELWHFGGEMDEHARGILDPFGVKCIDADIVKRARPFRFLEGHWWKGWQLKAYALVHSSFEEILYLDADCYPVRDPSFLFRTGPYRRHGAIFWPDIISSWGLLRKQLAKTFGVRPKEPPLESGQMLISKKACWRELQMALWYNEHADYVYHHVWGDKDTFNLAWQAFGRSYGMLQRRAGWDRHTILQYDSRGKVLFQHRCRDKFRLHNETFASSPQIAYEANQFHENLMHEKECFAFLEELRRTVQA